MLAKVDGNQLRPGEPPAGCCTQSNKIKTERSRAVLDIIMIPAQGSACLVRYHALTEDRPKIVSNLVNVLRLFDCTTLILCKCRYR